MQIIKVINLIVAFSLEIAMLIVLGYWGFQTGKTTFWKYTLAATLPLIAMLLWGILAAPRSEQRLDTPYRIAFELAMFFLASFLLYKSGYAKLGLSFAMIALLSESLALFLKQ